MTRRSTTPPRRGRVVFASGIAFAGFGVPLHCLAPSPPFRDSPRHCHLLQRATLCMSGEPRTRLTSEEMSTRSPRGTGQPVSHKYTAQGRARRSDYREGQGCIYNARGAVAPPRPQHDAELGRQPSRRHRRALCGAGDWACGPARVQHQTSRLWGTPPLWAPQGWRLLTSSVPAVERRRPRSARPTLSPRWSTAAAPRRCQRRCRRCAP